MPRGDKSKYTDKQKRQAEHIETGYRERGLSKKDAEGRAWATVNNLSGGGKKSGSGRRRKTGSRPTQTGHRKTGGRATTSLKATRPTVPQKTGRKKK